MERPSRRTGRERFANGDPPAQTALTLARRRAHFDVAETVDRIELAMRSADGEVSVDLSGRIATELPRSSVLRSVGEASTFFEGGSMGYSVTAEGGRLDGVVLRTDGWRVEPLAIERVHSSYFASESLFPRGSLTFDCALIMRNVEHEWHAAEDLYVERAR